MYTKKSDVFAFGLLVIEIFTGKDVSNIDETLNLTSNIPSNMQHLIQQCSASNPLNRPEFSEIIEILEDYYAYNWQENSVLESDNGVQQLYLSLVEKAEIIENKEKQISSLKTKLAEAERLLNLRADFTGLDPISNHGPSISITAPSSNGNSTSGSSSYPKRSSLVVRQANSTANSGTLRVGEENETRKRSDSSEEKPMINSNVPLSQAEKNITNEISSRVLKIIFILLLKIISNII